MNNVLLALGDGVVVAKRNLIKIIRVPEILVFVLISPIMFVLLFAFVFGSAIEIPGGISYREFLIPGIIVQTVVFGATFTGAGLAEDMQKGIIDRFRSLPMSDTAVLLGRTTSDIVYNVLSIIIMSLTGLLIGWRLNGSLAGALGGYLVLIAFSFAVSWIMAYVGLLVPSPEVVNNASFVVIFPLTFVANTFVPTDGFPAALKTFADWNPVSAVAQATRELWGNEVPVPAGTELPFSLEEPVIYTLIWVVIILAVFVPLSTRQYRRSASK